LSVRRLALDQPASFAFKPVTLKAARAWMANFPAGRQASAVIAILSLVQKQEGWVCEPAICAVAEACHAGDPGPRDRHLLHDVHAGAGGQPRPGPGLRPPCQTRSSEALLAVCKRRFGRANHLSADGKFYGPAPTPTSPSRAPARTVTSCATTRTC
jgi:NADH-quinone oxidoreductase subunit E